MRVTSNYITSALSAGRIYCKDRIGLLGYGWEKWKFILFIYEFTVAKNDNKIQTRNTIHIKANASVRNQGISLTDQ